MMRGNSKQGFILSALLHGGVATAVVILSLVKPPEEVREKPFELVYGLPTAEPLPEPGGVAEPSVSVNLPPPVSVPRTPRSTPPPRPQPQPQPPPRQPEPVRTPAPSTPAPAPQKSAPVSKPAPQTQTYAEWVREHGRPQPTRARTTAPRTRRTAIPRLDTDYSNIARGTVTNQGSLSGTTDAEQSALGRYISAVTDLLHDAWDKPVGLAQSTSAIVEFDITPEGRFVNVRITKGSGNSQFDQSVRECFRDADSPGSPPNGKTLSLRLTISMTDE